ncbi:MAG: hypothetical protein Q9191_006224 [Dirinaria sp. TL-2023a]
METLRHPPKTSELLPKTITPSSASFENVKQRLKCLASPPTSIATLPSSPKSKHAHSSKTVAVPTAAIEPALNVSTAAASALPLSKIFIVQKFHVSPSMPIDEKTQAVWNQQISGRLSGVIQQGIPKGVCLQEFMMAGERPDALRPTVIVSCGDAKIRKEVKKTFKRQKWLHDLLKANRIMLVLLVAKTHLSAGPALDVQSMLALSESCAVPVEQSELTTSCGMKLLIRGADQHVQQHCTLGGLLIVDGKILGLTAGHPFQKNDQYLAEQDSSGGSQVAANPEEECSSTTSDEPFVFNGDDDDDDDDGSKDDKAAFSLSVPKNQEDSPMDTEELSDEQHSRFESYPPLKMWHTLHSTVLPDSCPSHVPIAEDNPHHGYDWQLLSSLSPAVTSRPNKIAHVDLRHNIPIEETVSGPASGDVIINIVFPTAAGVFALFSCKIAN